VWFNDNGCDIEKDNELVAHDHKERMFILDFTIWRSNWERKARGRRGTVEP
jgi:hypothetical protein